MIILKCCFNRIVHVFFFFFLGKPAFILAYALGEIVLLLLGLEVPARFLLLIFLYNDIFTPNRGRELPLPLTRLRQVVYSAKSFLVFANKSILGNNRTLLAVRRAGNFPLEERTQISYAVVL